MNEIGQSMPLRRAAPRTDPNRTLSHYVGSEIDDTRVAAPQKHGGLFFLRYWALCNGNVAAISEAAILLRHPHNVNLHARIDLPN